MAAPATPLTGRATEKLGELLVRENLLTREQLAKALQEQAANPGQRLGLTVVRLGLVPETDVVRMLARQYRMPDQAFALEYARGWVPSMLPFGTFDIFFSTLDFVALLQTFKIYGRHVIRELLQGKF